VKVAFVSPEFQSLVRRTNLALVAESLALALRASGSDTRAFIPWSLDLDPKALVDLREVATVQVPDRKGPQAEKRLERVAIHQGLLRGMPVYLVAHEELLGSRYSYGDEQEPYSDNWRRYALFARAVLESFAPLGFEPEIVHCCDWTTGLIPLFHRLDYVEPDRDHPASRAGTYFAIHNFAMQGLFERDILPLVGIPHRYFRQVAGIESAGKVSFLKAGAEFATIVGTHSPSHAQKIQERDRGYGLEDTFQRRRKELVGINNGIDYQAWDPTTDPVLPAPFSARDREFKGKARCKLVLQQKLGLDNGPRTPIACSIGRWDADSGFDILAEILTPVLERGVELVVMGSGSAEIQQRLKTMETTFLGRCRLIEGYQTATAHLLMAGADFMLAPSHYQPSNPLFAIGMRYGVVPILYARSGLEETLPDFGKNQRHGLGFHFEPYTGEGLLSGIDAGLKLYKHPGNWKTLVRRAMSQDYSWTATAEEYVKAYRRVTRRAKSREPAK
jgi:starch synthase